MRAFNKRLAQRERDIRTMPYESLERLEKVAWDNDWALFVETVALEDLATGDELEWLAARSS